MCTVQSLGSSTGPLNLTTFGPGLIMPLTFLPSHFMTMTTALLLPSGPHSPRHVPSSGNPSCDRTARASTRLATIAMHLATKLIDPPARRLLRAALIARREHRDRKNLDVLLVVRHAEQRLLVRAAERDGDQRQRRRNLAEELAAVVDDLHAVAAGGVDPALVVDGAAIATGERELPLVSERTVGLHVVCDEAARTRRRRRAGRSGLGRRAR